MADKQETKSNGWLWIVGGAVALLAIVASDNAWKEEQALAESRAGYSPAMKSCLERQYANLPEETLVQMCREEVSGAPLAELE